MKNDVISEDDHESDPDVKQKLVTNVNQVLYEAHKNIKKVQLSQNRNKFKIKKSHAVKEGSPNFIAQNKAVLMSKVETSTFNSTKAKK